MSFAETVSQLLSATRNLNAYKPESKPNRFDVSQSFYD